MKKLVAAGKRMKPKPHTDGSTFLGALDQTLQVNLTKEQKATIVEKAQAAGLPLSAYVRVAALTAGEDLERAVKKALADPRNA